MLAGPDRTASRVARALLFAAGFWAVAIVVTPWLAGAAPPSSTTLLASAGVYRLGAVVCHQRPDRSFRASGGQWPVCARCAGLYVAAGAAAWLVLLLPRRLRERCPAGRTRGAQVLVWAGAPTVVSWLGEHAGWLAPSNAVRATLAVPLGLVVCWLLVLAWRTAESAAAPEVN